MRHNLSINSIVTGPTRLMAWYVIFVSVEPPLPQPRPSFSASLSCDVSIFPSFLLSTALLCVMAGHVTPSHLHTVGASPSYVNIQNKSLQLDFLSKMSNATFFHIIFQITASLSYSKRIQKRIICEKTQSKDQFP